MLRLSLLLGLVALCTATVLPVRPERKIADAEFLKKQKKILDLYAGIGHNLHFKNEFDSWDIAANYGNFVDEKYPKKFVEAYKRGGFLPMDAIFSMACPHTMHDMIKLFDLFYFAKDFDTFYAAASWARSHINPSVFGYAYSLALVHRHDTRDFALPPLYEVLPNYFVPTETLHQVLDHKMAGLKEGRFTFNNSGYEHNYHSSMFGGVLSRDNKGHSEFRIAYFREDVGLNSWLTYWFGKNPSWMCPEKYGKVRFERRGENFYYTLQQLFARYTLERIANGLPFVNILAWNEKIKVGYNPRLSYLNGQSMYVRPDEMNPTEHNLPKVLRAEQLERRIWDVIDAGIVWEVANKSFISIKEGNGMETLGRLIYGTTDRPSKNYFKSIYYAGLDALAYIVSTASDRSYIGGAMSSPMTAARDPAFYKYLARVLLPINFYKKSLGPYQHEELVFPGVKIEKVEVDKFLTYFDMFDFEVTNAVPMHDPKDYIDHKYFARQYRLNHKPYRFNITVNCEATGDAMVRVFLGPKYDADDHLLNIEQARLAYFEIDRFPVKLGAGQNIWERSSTDSPIFEHDQESFRSLYQSLQNAEGQKGEYYVTPGGRCGFPDRLQLPMGWKGGRNYILAVVITPLDSSKMAANEHGYYDIACGGSRLYDGRPMGFPFDRPVRHGEFSDVHNIYFTDVPIYHKEEAAVNRPMA